MFGEALIPGSNDFKHGLQVKSEWKKLGRAEQKDKVEAKYLKAA